MRLAGDVGGTKALVGLFEEGTGRPALVDAREYATRDYAGLEQVIEAFLAAQPSRAGALAAASFGVAGPIVDQVAGLTNVPWVVDAAALAVRFRIPHVTLLNDLQAMAYSVEVLEPGELAVIQEGRAVPTGNAALIAAGTGLGEALLHRVGGRLIPSPTEGGHADFAPRTADEIALLGHLVTRFGRADYEHVISGPGLSNIHRFTHPDGCPACGLRITETGTRDMKGSIGAFDRNASMKRPSRSAGRIFGAMPPPTNTPAVATERRARLPASAP